MDPDNLDVKDINSESMEEEIECNRNKDTGNGLPTFNGQSEPFHSDILNSLIRNESNLPKVQFPFSTHDQYELEVSFVTPRTSSENPLLSRLCYQRLWGSRNRRALILGWAYYLDAFSSYPLRTWLPSVYRGHDNWYTRAWGGKKRLYSATKFILYTAGGSVFLLIGVLGIGGVWYHPIPRSYDGGETQVEKDKKINDLGKGKVKVLGKKPPCQKKVNFKGLEFVCQATTRQRWKVILQM
ncbi:hypothetical protein LWI28_021821 [Acer negundo]|uniref:Uncharacterized protein n=1 Tax=Acer negundo TaxID=4023 RepID=A0AAD5NTT1_ACENE|nr:hypothetical protein LWI28_021821 [Acer negundo]